MGLESKKHSLLTSAPAGSTKPAALAKCSGIYLCDLPLGLTEMELRQVFAQYGEIVQVRQADAAPDEAVMIDYTTHEAAEEAQGTVNLAYIRGKTCRCLLVSAVEVIRKTMVTSHRIIIENLDLAIEVHGLWDVCSLFGKVLDCKLQLDQEGKSCGYGFVHYAAPEEAQYAFKVLDKMQIGECEVKLRPFQWDDASLFTGTLYARLIYNPYSDVVSPAAAMPPWVPNDGGMGLPLQ